MALSGRAHDTGNEMCALGSKAAIREANHVNPSNNTEFGGKFRAKTHFARQCLILYL